MFFHIHKPAPEGLKQSFSGAQTKENENNQQTTGGNYL
jgi:hypothetical protein